MNYIIYMYTNPLNNLKYIGRTSLVNEKIRKLSHGYDAKKNKTRWHKAVNANGGIHNFNYTILAYVKYLESAEFLEKHFIYQYKTTNPLFGYNTRIGGGSRTGINTKSKEHYATKTNTRGNFKRTCARVGWDFNDFDELDSYKKTKKGERLYYYHYNA